MKKHFLWLGFYAVAQLACSCRHQAEDVVPAPMQPTAIRATNPLASNYDTIARANGHWEWDGWFTMGGRKTPATEGYTRQLVFRIRPKLLIKHNGQPYDSVTYQFPVNVPPATPGVGVMGHGTLVYTTPEPTLRNNERKYFHVSTNYQGLLLLDIQGEGASVDAGAYESYHWVKE